MKILMISYLQLEKEGRFSRAYEALKENHEVFIIDTNDKEMSVDSARASYYSELSGMRRYFEFCRFVIAEAKKFEYDLIYACNYYAARPVLDIIRRKKAPVLYDAYELYYPEAKKSFSKRDLFFYHYEKKMIKRAESVIAASDERALIMTGHYCLKKVPFTVRNMPFSFDASRMPETRSISDGEKIKIVYAGYIGEGRRIDELIDAISSSSLRDRVLLDVYGYGPLDISQYKYDFLTYRGSYNNSELDSILKNYHIGFVSYVRTDLNTIYCCPNKVYDYVCAGLVVVSPYNEGLDAIINRNSLGVCDDDLFGAINKCVNDYGLYAGAINKFLGNNDFAENVTVLNRAVAYALSEK